MTGATPTKINFVIYQAQLNSTASAILESQGLGYTPESFCKANRAFTNFINKRFETYGRKFVSLDGPGGNRGSGKDGCDFPYFQGTCETADSACQRAEAKVIVSMKPAFVLSSPGNRAWDDELVKNRIIMLAGIGPREFFERDHPYYYGLIMDGTRQSLLTSEHWCKKLNKRPAEFAGDDVKATRNWGPRPGVVPTRKLAVLYPADEGDDTAIRIADFLSAQLAGKRCTSPGGLLEIRFRRDLSTAQQQSTAIVQQLIEKRITTVICWCDPLAMLLIAQKMEEQNYHPEHLLGGLALNDDDRIGRLMHPGQWRHAFGLSGLGEPVPWSRSDATKAYQDGGEAGEPHKIADFQLWFFIAMALGIMEAGPSPTAEGIHQGLFNLPHFGGWERTKSPHLIEFGLDEQSPWTFFEDVREVYWSATRNSSFDGKPGSYCPVARGRRYNLNEIPPGETDVFNSAKNGC